MRKRPNEKALKEIKALFELAKQKALQKPKLAIHYVARARKLAKHNNISLREYRKFFCKKCNSFFTVLNSQIRIKKGWKTIKCLCCGSYRRFKIKTS